jgi:hypothetical protein
MTATVVLVFYQIAIRYWLAHHQCQKVHFRIKEIKNEGSFALTSFNSLII